MIQLAVDAALNNLKEDICLRVDGEILLLWHEESIDLHRSLPSLRDGPHHQRLTTSAIPSSKNSLHIGRKPAIVSLEV